MVRVSQQSGDDGLPRSEQAHVPELDGLRAVAIGLVMLFHFTGPPLTTPAAQFITSFTRGGWIGVDLFFVLSGFLITGICLDHRGPGFFRAFYWRRALRILPAYALVLVVFAAVSLTATGSLPAGFTSLATFTTNLSLARNGANAVPPMASHLWSLAVEEQFYLVWPLCVVALPRRLALWLAIAALPMAVAVRAWLIFGLDLPLAAYVLTPARMDALAVGALLAFLVRSPHWPALRSRGAALGTRAIWIYALPLAVVCWTARVPAAISTTPFGHTVLVVRYSVIAALAAMLVLLALSSDGTTALARLLRRPGVQWLGRRSYAAYLIHLPVASLLGGIGMLPRTTLGLLLFVTVSAVLTCALAELSWRMIEQPALRLKRFARYRGRARADREAVTVLPEPASA